MVASGVSLQFNVNQGNNNPVIVILSEVVGIGKGTFTYTITCPVGADIEITLEHWPNLEQINLNSESLTGENGITGTLELAAGSYQFSILVSKDGFYTGKNETVRIYSETETTYTASFGDADLLVTTVNLPEITITAPEIGVTPVTVITETSQYTGTVSWDGNPSVFVPSIPYTATITLTAKTGFTLYGVAADFFTVAGAISVHNSANSGVITAVFPPKELDEEFDYDNFLLFEDFESTNIGLLGSAWTLSSSAIISTGEIEQAGNANFGNNGKFLKLPAVIGSGGGKTVLERSVYVKQNSIIKFKMKTDIIGLFGQYFRFFIDGTEMGVWEGNINKGRDWRTVTLLLSSGQHTLKFEVSSTGNSVPGGLDAVYLDDINIFYDVTSFVVMYPRAQLNTYIGVPEKDKIQFRAQALFPDRTLRESVHAFTFSGNGIDSVSGVFTPQTAGNTIVTVSVDGKSASRAVTVHPADYMRRPFYYSGTNKTYNGFAGTEGSVTISGGVTVTYPSEKNFNADGFFTIEGVVNNSAAYNYAYIILTKDSDFFNLRTIYLVRDSFKLRVWLRFGPGTYTIRVHGISDIGLASNLGAEGDWVGECNWNGDPVTFYVNNTRSDDFSVDSSVPDKRFIYPSYVCQSDSFTIRNLAAELTYGLTSDYDKIKAIHDYVAANTAYDYDSMNNDNRKKQDALTVLGTRYHDNSAYDPDGNYLAVCEGFSNTCAALLRSVGIEVQYISSPSMSHGWNQIYVNGGWKLLDATWDINRYNPSEVKYDYFLLDSLNGINGDHYGGSPVPGRVIINKNPIPKQKGVPDGWY